MLRTHAISVVRVSRFNHPRLSCQKFMICSLIVRNIDSKYIRAKTEALLQLHTDKGV